MKKRIAIFTILCMCSASLFALDLSAGLGGNFTANFRTWSTNSEYFTADDINSTLVGGGFYGFVDATYAEVNLGFLFGNEKFGKNDNKGINITALKLGLFGKYPINLGAFSIFPIFGIDGQIALAASSDTDGHIIDYYSPGDLFSQFWFKFGAGLDIPTANEKYYIRFSFLYGFRPNTKFEEDGLAEAGLKSVVNHGLDIKLAIGYKLY